MAYVFEEDKKKTEAKDALLGLKSTLLDMIYPVGSIYMSVNNVSPQTLFGGTWQKIEGRFLIAANNTYKNGATGGSADATVVSHTHTVSGTAVSAGKHDHGVNKTEVDGMHTHPFGRYPNGGSGSSILIPRADMAQNLMETLPEGLHQHDFAVKSAGAHTHTVNGTAASAGSSGTGKNMPPYLAVNMWKRTA